jgi:hypothetical protein
MKKLKPIFFLLLLSQLAIGQEFSFKMYFEDSVGNKDTLTIGYDQNATDTIDSEFGEINIISIPLVSSLDVRISNEWHNRHYQNISGTFHTKKQIIEKKDCGVYYTVNCIDIFTDNWPVTVYWDSTLFGDTCLNGSLFTSVMPGGWWDTGGFREILQSNSSYSFNPNYPFFNEYYGYVTNNNDTIDVFWQTFGDSTILMMGIEESMSNELRIFPNPTSNIISFQFKEQDLQIENIRVFDINGKPQPITVVGKNIDLTELANGLYFIRFTKSAGETITKKIIKNNAR